MDLSWEKEQALLFGRTGTCEGKGAKIYAELAGYGATADAWHITSPAEDGEGAAMAMKLAMREAGVRAEQNRTILMHMGTKHASQRSV